MKFINAVYNFLAQGEADKEVAHNLTDSFTGIEAYWNPDSK